MEKKMKRLLKAAFKFVVIACTILVGILIVSGLPLEELKEKIQNKIKD